MKIEIRQSKREFVSERLGEFFFVVYLDGRRYGSSLKGKSHGTYLDAYGGTTSAFYTGEL